MTVGFIGGGNRSIQRKPPSCHKLLTNLSHNVVSSTPRHERDSNSQVVICTDCIGSYNSTTIRPRRRWICWTVIITRYFDDRNKSTTRLSLYIYRYFLPNYGLQNEVIAFIGKKIIILMAGYTKFIVLQ